MQVELGGIGFNFNKGRFYYFSMAVNYPAKNKVGITVCLTLITSKTSHVLEQGLAKIHFVSVSVANLKKNTFIWQLPPVRV